MYWLNRNIPFADACVTDHEKYSPFLSLSAKFCVWSGTDIRRS